MSDLNNLSSAQKSASPMLEWALWYAAQGLPVLPLHTMHGDKCSCGKDCGRDAAKHPASYGGLADATLDPEQIRRWWTAAPDANIGIAIPDGFVVLDVDPRNGGKLPEGDLPETWTVATGGDGIHMIYRITPGTRVPKFAKGIDVKQLGGYIVAPPSLHKSGKQYRFAERDQIAIAQAPEWLRAKCIPRDAVAVVVDDDLDGNEVQADLAIIDPLLNRIADAWAPLGLLPEGNGRQDWALAALGWLLRGGFTRRDLAVLMDRLEERGWVRTDEYREMIPRADPGRTHGPPAALKEKMGARFAELDAIVNSHPRAAELEGRRREGSIVAQIFSDLPALKDARQPANDGNARQPANDRSHSLDAFCDFYDLRALPTPLKYACKGLSLAVGKVSVLSGWNGGGKSPFAMLFAICSAAGLPFIGMPVEKAPALYLAFEGGHLSMLRMHRMCLALGARPGDLPLRIARMKAGLSADLITAISAYVEGLPPSPTALRCTIIVDTLTSAMRGKAMKDSEYADLLWALGDLSEALDVAVLVLAHENKSADKGDAMHGVAGTFAITAAAQTVIKLKRDDANPNVFEVQCGRAPENEFLPFGMRWVDGWVDESTERLAARIAGELQPLRAERLNATKIPGPTTKTKGANDAKRAEGRALEEKTALLIWRRLGFSSVGGARTSLALETGHRDPAIRAIGKLESAGLLTPTHNGMVRIAAGAEETSEARILEIIRGE